MTLQTFLLILRKRFWIVLLTTILVAGGVYLISLRIVPTYQSQTTLLVGQLSQGSDITAASAATDAQLAQAHALLAKKPDLLTVVAQKLGTPGGWQELYFKVDARVTGGQVLDIVVTDSDPGRAKLIADAVANQLIVSSPLNTRNLESAEQREFITSEQGILKTQIQNGRDKLNSLNEEAALENDPTRLSSLNSQIESLQAKVDKWQDSYVNLTGLLKTDHTSFITILLPADVPTTPISPNVFRNVVLALIAGLVLGGAIIYLLEYLDNTIKSQDDTQQLLNLSTLAVVTRMTGLRQLGDSLITVKHPRSPISEAFRSLRTNLRFAGLENPSGALLVTSPGPGEGKSTIAANLAVVMAQAGKRVVLVDTDLRRPSLHKLFALPNHLGLSNLFLDEAPPINAALQPTFAPGLRVLTSGRVPPNPAEMLDSKRMAEIIRLLREESDMVIFDSPPLLAVTDASIIGSRCSGAVLVLHAGKTRGDVAQRAEELLRNAGIQTFGAILNRQSERRASSYYYYYYYASQENPTESEPS